MLLATSWTAVLEAQIRTATSTLTITVKDSSGSVIPQADIVLVRGNEERKLETGQDGVAKVPDMLAGEYSLTVKHDAFVARQRPVILQGQPLDITVTLDLAPVQQNVLVQAPPEVATTDPLDQSSSRASFLDIPLRDLPYNVQIVTQERIQERGVTHMLDALELAPGVTTWADSGGYIPAVDFRGQSTTDAGIYIAREGIIQNSVPQSIRNIDTFLLESVEVQKGPASFSYGSGVSGGAINMQTKNPRREFGMDSLLAYESFGRTRFGFGANVPLTEKLSGRLDFSRNRGGSNLQRSTSTMQSISTGLLWNPIPRVTITAKGILSMDDLIPSTGVPILNSQVDPNVEYIELAPGKYLDPRVRALNYQRTNPRNEGMNNFGILRAEVDLPHGWRLRNILSRSAVRLYALHNEGISFSQTTLLVTPSFFPNYKRDDQWVDQLDIRNTVRVFGRTINFTVGAMVDDNLQRRHALLGGTSSVGTPPAMSYLAPVPFEPLHDNIVRDRNIDTNQKAGYFETMIRLTSRLTLSGGSRIDHVRNTRYTYSDNSTAGINYHAVTGRYALTYALTPTVTLYIGRSNAVQPNTASANSTGATALVNISQSQADFMLMRSRQWEGGVKATTWRNRIEGSLSYFNSRKHDIMTQTEVDGVTQLERVGKILNEGVEFQFTARPIRIFTLQGDFTWQNGEYLVFRTVSGGVEVDRSGNKLARVPAVLWSVTPTLRIGPVSGNVSIKTRGATWNDNLNTQRLRAFTLVSSNVSIRLARGTTLTLTGRNLTDFVNVNRGGLAPTSTTARIGLPRNYGIQLTKSFL
jgi:iron complex outermembrane receptor protein